jgi:NADPH2:quinone reductase
MNQSTSNKGFALKIIEDSDAPMAQRLSQSEKPLPQLKPGQVLLKVHASVVNPSDLIYLKGKYGLPPVEGAYAGFEGCGTVIATNAGLYGKWLIGKRVAMAAQPGNDGFWCQYAVTLANLCLPLRKDISDEQASTIIVNPCTSVCLVDRAKTLGAKAIIINAAASQVGKGVIRYANLLNIKVIATVRSQANIDVLQKLGVEQALLTTSPTFKADLTAAAKALRATVLLDAVAADDTALVLHCMPSRSTAIVYGRLTESQDPIGGQFGVADILFRDSKIEGFWLANYMRYAKPWQILALSKKVQRLFAQGIFQTDVYASVGFEDFIPALAHYAVNKSDGKVIFVP